MVEETALAAELDGSALVQRAQEGDSSAFEMLYRREVGRIYALCLRMTADEVRAATLTQDTFVRAWRRLGQFRKASSFSTWLYRIGVNVVLTSERSNARRRARVVSKGDRSDLEAATRTAQPDVTRGEGSRRDAALDLEEAIGRLPTQAKAVLILHEIEGYTHAEIGEMLEIATGTSKAHLHRARTLLKEMLKA